MIKDIFNDKTSDYKLSGDNFFVAYRIRGNEKEALEKAKDICIEQTVEFLPYLIPDGMIKDSLVGKIKTLEPDGPFYKAVISYAIETTAFEFTQFLNVIFGNSSIKPGIYVQSIDLPGSLLKIFRGPRFGIEGLRKILKISERPLLCTALKPMGLSSEGLGQFAYDFALGGIDIIKDDHGLTDQPFAPFEERVKCCVEGVNKANKETGSNSIYVANITSPFSEIEKRAAFAKKAGAGGLLIAPGLTGLDTMKHITEDDNMSLPVISHPAFQGSYVMGENGISHGVLFGQIPRLAGADATIYPNFGGRFSFTREECKDIMEGVKRPMGHLKTIFPCPGGGMGLENIPDLFSLYGNDVIYLVGGGLFKAGDDLIENCKYFRRMVEKKL